MRGVLCLEDGFFLEGELLNYTREMCGEVVFFTGMSGYEEALTDPAYTGQIMVFTFPMVGAYGLPLGSGQSSGITVRGMVARDIWDGPVDGAAASLRRGLEAGGCPAIHGVNTRELAIHLREHGCKKGVIAAVPAGGLGSLEMSRLMASAAKFDMTGVVDEVACRAESAIDVLENTAAKTCVLMDFGTKSAIIAELGAIGLGVVRVSPKTPPEGILKWNPACVLLSSGPGDPDDNPEAIDTVSTLIGRTPLFGISLGHQIIARAAGSRVKKLKFGHHGTQPVKDLRTERSVGTSQNHNFVVDDSSMPAGLFVTHRNLNDGTVEGLELREHPGGRVLASSVQFNPEGAPGPSYRPFWALMQEAKLHA